MLYIDDFLSYLTLERNYSKATAEAYSFDLSLLNDYLLQQGANRGGHSEIDPRQIDEEDVRSWMAHMMEQGEKATSVNRRLSALRTFYKYLRASGRSDHDPTRRLQGPRNERPLPYFMKETEVNRLLDAPIATDNFEAVRNRLMIDIFYHTGIRVTEMVNLNTTEVDTATGQLRVTGKGNKQRIVPFGPELGRDIEAYLKLRTPLAGPDPALIVTRKGRRMSKKQIERCVHSLLTSYTTIKKRSPHVLRHTFATAMLNHQADIEVVRQLLGHESLAATEVYTHTTFEELKQVYNKAHPRS